MNGGGGKRITRVGGPMGCNLSVFKRTIDTIAERMGLPLAVEFERGSGQCKFSLKWLGQDTMMSAVFFSEKWARITDESAPNVPEKGWAWRVEEEYLIRPWHDQPDEPMTEVIIITRNTTTAASRAVSTLLETKVRSIADSIYPNCNDDIPF